MSNHLKQNLNLFQCPECLGDLSLVGESIECKKCKSSYKTESGIPLLYAAGKEEKNTVTDKVKGFYEKNPFPNYNDLDNISSLVRKAKRSIFGRLLHEQIPGNTKVLEVGCGTGQLSNYLSITNRKIFGVDMSYNSLLLGQKFKEQNDLTNVGFYQMNIFKPIFKKESFHYVICNGVLHHTKDPLKGFSKLVDLVKKDGYIIIGLYNKYGRLVTDIRRMLINLLGESMKKLDPNLRGNEMDSIKKSTWYLDQYKNPHESKHTIKEVLEWFEDHNVEFINCIPKLDITEPFNENEKLFEKSDDLSSINILLSQLKQIFTGSREGGLFIMIGKKNK